MLERRRAFDPDDVFLTKAWSARLGLGPAISEPLRPFVVEDHAPLRYGLAPSGLEFVERASRVIDVRVNIEAPADVVYDVFAGYQRYPEFIPGFVRFEQWTPHLPPERQRFREHFSFMTLDLHMLAADRPRRWAAAVEASSVPLAKEAVEVVDFIATGRVSCQVRWRIAFEPLPEIAWADGVILPLFRRWFEGALFGLKRLVEAERR
jgi:hypothetical protein